MIGSTGAKTGVLALILALLPTLLSAAVVRISWNANTEGDLEGYRVFFGTSHGYYGNVINVGRRTTVDVSGLAAGTTYFFAVTAYDYSGNESGYSTEQSLFVPLDNTTNDSTNNHSTESPDEPDSREDDNLVNDLVDVVEWLEQIVRNIFDLDPDIPVYALGNFGTVDSMYLPNPSGSAILEDYTGQEPSDINNLCSIYPVCDLILQTGCSFDISTVYPSGAYLFYPLSNTSPVIDGDIITPWEPGVFVYVAFNETGCIDHLLRLSVAEKIFEMSVYDPEYTQLIEDIISGIAIELPYHATGSTKPIAIGWGGFNVFADAAMLAVDPNAFFFDIMPYGLELSYPAQISLPFSGNNVVIEWYDEDNRSWVTLDDIQVTNGLLSFSAQTLGRFKVSVPPGTVSEDAPFEGREVSCFVSVAGGRIVW